MPGSTLSTADPERARRSPPRGTRSASSAPASGWTRPSSALAALDDRHLRAHAARRTARARRRPGRRRGRRGSRGTWCVARRLAVRPVLDLVDALDRRDRGPRPGRDDELVVRKLLRRRPRRRPAAPRGPRRARAGSSSPGGSRSWPESSQSLVIQSRHDQTPSGSGRSAVRPGARSSEARELGRPQHRLRRHAREVRALAADEPALDERDLRLVVEPAEGADEMLAGRPSAENDDLQLLELVRLQEPVRDLLRRLLVDVHTPCSSPASRRASASPRPRCRLLASSAPLAR